MTALPFDNSYARLPGRFYSRVRPDMAPAPELIRLNHGLADMLRLDIEWLSSPDGVAMLAGGALPGEADSIAMAYAGHQFGGWVPQLGDGRALLLGEVVGRDGVRRDIQLKGSGRTPYSRQGDGKAPLGPVLREYIVSEAMAALGVPTSRSLAAVLTGETVYRETPLPGAVLTRVAESHIRVGTFQYFGARGDRDGLCELADYAIARHYPQAAESDRPYRKLLDGVISRQARLIPEWMGLGFIHGVMNTDNMQVAGETIDYGPCAFMEAFDPKTVFSSIDHFGRYAWVNQPRIAEWNLARLAEALIPLLGDDEEEAIADARDALSGFAPQLSAGLAATFERKFGLPEGRDGNAEFIESALSVMAENAVDFTLFFRELTRFASCGSDAGFKALFRDNGDADVWLGEWRTASGTGDARDLAARMRRQNPVFIPRNHRVEEAIRHAMSNDFGPFQRLVDVLGAPYREQPEHAELERPPRPEERVQRTFCGT